MAEIKLNNGHVALVDDDDYEHLSQFKWYENAYGYALTYIKTPSGKWVSLLMHRKLMQTPKGMETDHLNHIRLDNRRGNLAIVTPTQNRQRKLIYSNNTSGVTNVTRSKTPGRWRVTKKVGDRKVSVGTFGSIAEATKALEEFKEELRGKSSG